MLLSRFSRANINLRKPTIQTRSLRNTYFKSGNRGWQGFYRRGVDPNNLFLGIIGANVAVYGVFVFSDAQWKRFNDPKWMRFMLKNFTASWYNISSGRIWTLVTSSFLHTRLDSLIFNMLTFYFMAPQAIAMLGARTFLMLYCGGGLAASAVTLSNPSNGASGAVGSTLGFFAASFPNATFSLYFLLPVQAWMAVGGLVAWDAYNSFNSPYSANAHKSRLSGTVAGVAFAMLRMRGIGPRIPWR
ncbi:hypothetical protein WALSEDRAFT_68015 [Wallemia mellicola CBS 633.66]|uniref:Peptidase S54 rhomboid domain-containing protein n=1 Tax=Wallemia mellicola (strain ATCC MYA-4683 / CBS 633.66) TaxID=671144 RepID=I4YF05_WALMC|nr:hypothetical protein WALSEDRAFT_68015 [Wallemia mellicola CBS 633.66]EIM22547.1 hypothetical protein WALSEDRAFT_68015 [Wallemia mellicola CBS 633.66]|eukprot:XP_006957217.1 hypothetical protein WALSEDRAFT_68015 [Wallemia mellicola CBS 633.66]